MRKGIKSLTLLTLLPLLGCSPIEWTYTKYSIENGYATELEERYPDRTVITKYSRQVIPNEKETSKTKEYGTR